MKIFINHSSNMILLYAGMMMKLRKYDSNGHKLKSSFKVGLNDDGWSGLKTFESADTAPAAV